jgi:hypothetical protein
VTGISMQGFDGYRRLVPRMTADSPAPGRRVRRTLPRYDGTDVYHALYLPRDFREGAPHPVIVEYAGNGPYRAPGREAISGRVEDTCLGYGIGAGDRFIWLSLPFVSVDLRRNQLTWWGDVERTVEYCLDAVGEACRSYGGDEGAILLAGFSRGAIACNYIGLHDDRISSLWRGFFAHSHYDGVRQWEYAGSDRAAAVERLRRLGGRPQFISHEGSVDAVKAYLASACPEGRFTFCALPFADHTDAWVLADSPERAMLRAWVDETLDG